jgi:ribosome biogenesis SPOUT family RNA methylase Rps3
MAPTTERKLQNKMNLKTFTESMLPAIETELQRFVSKLDEPRTCLFHERAADRKQPENVSAHYWFF